MSFLILILTIINIINTIYCKKFITYWGQNSGGNERTLNSYCQIKGINVINIGFMHKFDGIKDPRVNLAYHCYNPYCASVENAINYCRDKGIIIMLSLGGGSSNYNLKSEKDALNLADQVYTNFFTLSKKKKGKFGNAIFDGIDLNIQNGKPDFYHEFVDRLRGLVPDIKISATPQCSFPDHYLKVVLEKVKLDWISVQFYNNPCNLNNNNEFNFKTWNEWSIKHSNTPIIVGVPGGPRATGSGFIETKELQNKIYELEKFPNFGGIMMWDASYAFANNAIGPEIMQTVHRNDSKMGYTFYKEDQKISFEDDDNNAQLSQFIPAFIVVIYSLIFYL